MFSYMQDYFEKHKKKVFKNLTDPLRNFLLKFPYHSDVELGDGTVVDRGWFRMLWGHSNTVYGRNISCACGEL